MNVKCHILHQTYLFQKMKKSFKLKKSTYTIIQKLGVGKILFFWKVSFAHQGCIYLIKKLNIVKYHYNLKEQFSMGIYCKM